ncbi:hypothetical protein [Streptosporangium longisporum]|uniref:ATP-binding protein n=1 Tax=Streptosporangium longisporum TaxID=46187 RepID=A0ABP6L2L5_9ACTN
MHENYEKSFAPASADGAQDWVHTIVLKRHPHLARRAAQAVVQQMAIARRRTPANGTIRLTVLVTDAGLTMKVRNPGRPISTQDGAEWSELSLITDSFRATRTDTGHLTEVVLLAEAVVA